jgi:hypothetical protein
MLSDGDQGAVCPDCNRTPCVTLCSPFRAIVGEIKGNTDSEKQRRFVAYKKISTEVFHFTKREILPACCVERIRVVFPDAGMAEREVAGLGDGCEPKDEIMQNLISFQETLKKMENEFLSGIGRNHETAVVGGDGIEELYNEMPFLKPEIPIDPQWRFSDEHDVHVDPAAKDPPTAMYSCSDIDYTSGSGVNMKEQEQDEDGEEYGMEQELSAFVRESDQGDYYKRKKSRRIMNIETDSAKRQTRINASQCKSDAFNVCLFIVH